MRSLICFISNEYNKIKRFKKSVVGYIVGWTPEFFSCLGYIGIPTVPVLIPVPEEIQLPMYVCTIKSAKISQNGNNKKNTWLKIENDVFFLINEG